MQHAGFVDALKLQGEAAMEATPALKHQWRVSEERLVLRIPAVSPDGFDVELEASADGLELRCGRMHTPLDDASDPAVSICDALGLVRDLLSPAMRLREICASGNPYRWCLEATTERGWRVEYRTGLLFWNFLGRRSERIYRNDHLPAREA